VLAFVLICTCLLGTISYIPETLNNEKERYVDYETLNGSEMGLPLSITDSLNSTARAHFNEIDGLTMKKKLGVLPNVLAVGDIVSRSANIPITYTKLLRIISEKMLQNVNEGEDKPFTVVNQVVLNKSLSSVDQYNITVRHVLYREGKSYGFVVITKSLFDKTTLDFSGFYEALPVGVVLEDTIKNIQGIDTDNDTRYREYGDNTSFIQGEAIMKTKEYEEEITRQQIYGLLQDRGISAKSSN